MTTDPKRAAFFKDESVVLPKREFPANCSDLIRISSSIGRARIGLGTLASDSSSLFSKALPQERRGRPTGAPRRDTLPALTGRVVGPKVEADGDILITLEDAIGNGVGTVSAEIPGWSKVVRDSGDGFRLDNRKVPFSH